MIEYIELQLSPPYYDTYWGLGLVSWQWNSNVSVRATGSSILGLSPTVGAVNIMSVCFILISFIVPLTARHWGCDHWSSWLPYQSTIIMNSVMHNLTGVFFLVTLISISYWLWHIFLYHVIVIPNLIRDWHYYRLRLIFHILQERSVFAETLGKLVIACSTSFAVLLIMPQALWSMIKTPASRVVINFKSFIALKSIQNIHQY